MAGNRIFVLMHITILLLIILSSCRRTNSIPIDTEYPIRTEKYHLLSDANRSPDRMKQYHDTLAQLRLWRRYIIDEDNDDYPDILDRFKYAG